MNCGVEREFSPTIDIVFLTSIASLDETNTAPV